MPLAAPSDASADELLAALDAARAGTLHLVAPLSDEDAERVHSTLMSPLAWDLGHIAAFEDLWIVRRHGGRPMLNEDLADVYDAFETPRAGRGNLPFLGRPDAEAYLFRVRETTREIAAEQGIGDGVIFELVLRHELQHNETMLQTLCLARLEGYAPARRPGPAGPGGLTGLELVDVPAGPADIGAGPEGFAYDNERPRHRVELPAFRVGRVAITNATFLRFVEGGGYQRREWWSDEGWSWKEQYDITRPLHWSDDGREWRIGGFEPLHPDRPVVHVSWFEADAFARAHGARLPTEAEWEKAATWDHETCAARRNPWGEEPPHAGHANLGLHSFGAEPVGSHPAGASPAGCEGMLGDVWEWTSSDFGGYPGFRAFPYREYSEVFFGSEHKVLRGGSWASSARVATATFRNWDYPQRRQIFSGFRLARDAA